MPRKRQIDPEIWKDPDFIRLTFRQRLLFIGLFSNADDEGLIEADYAHVKAAIFPADVYQEMEYDTDLEMLQQVSCQRKNGQNVEKKSTLVVLYFADGRPIIWLTKWFRYQIIDHPTRSKLPRPSKKLLHKFPEYCNGWRKYFSDDSKSHLGALETGNPTPRGKVQESSLKGEDDPHWSYRAAVAFGRFCETPHLKTKQKWFRDLARQGVPTRAIEEAALDPKYESMDFFDITDDLRAIHLNGGRDGRREKAGAGKTGGPGTQAAVGHHALKPGELDEETNRRIAEREGRQGSGAAAGNGDASDRGSERHAAQDDAVPGAEKV
jgi:hypothetical protein